MVSVVKCMHEEEMDKVSALADHLEFLVITADCWRLVAQDGYTGVTVYCITNNWALKHEILAIWNVEEIHTAENLALQLQDVCKHYKINNHVTATDNASHIVKTLSLIG